MKTALLLAIVLLAALCWINARQRSEILGLTETVSGLKKASLQSQHESPARDHPISSPASKTADKESANPNSSANDAAFENALDAWIDKARRLSRYLETHPERKIPQLSLVTPQDWLEVTKDKDLESDADYREALGNLRGIARRKAAPTVTAALRQAVMENHGEAPSSLQALTPFLPADFDPACLQQLAVNPSGAIDGLREIGGKPTFFLVDNAVDLWDGTLFYAADGGYGSHAAKPRQQSAIQHAIADFTRANGSPPAEFSQLATAPELAAMDQAVAAEIFHALTAKPTF
ncbi:MAG TPA: hypothetical protein VG838_00055 [Opitutaceae bacterium]|nr:hypothetical protein [Opitutaceae bacterium]